MITFKLLEPENVTREILDILNILTETQYLSITHAKAIIAHQLRHYHFTWVGYIEDNPVCLGSVIILSKLGRNGSSAALIEDVAVKPEFQHSSYGKLLIEHLKRQSLAYNVYKIYLNCVEAKVGFYEKCGLEKSGIQMKIECKGE